MFKRNKESGKENPQALAVLSQKNPLTWKAEDVAQWVKAIGYGEYSAKFLKNVITGQELFTITGADLRAMGVSAMGHQKAILAKITALNDMKDKEFNGKTMTSGGDKGSPRGGQNSSKGGSHIEGELSTADDLSESQSSSAVNNANRLELVVMFADARRTVVAKRRYPLERILIKLEESFGFPVEILHNKQVLEDPTAWQELVSRQNPADPLEITVQRENPNKIHKEERAMLQGLSDSCIVIDHIGTILFVNLMTEELFGFESSELVGQNIKMLTPPEVRSKHDMYLRRYVETGNAKVIGVGRHVQVIHKKGHEISCWLSVTEQKKANGRHTFMGTLHEIKNRDVSQQTAKFAVLDGVQDAVMVINSQGVIQFMNSRMEKLLGYGKDHLGRNVSTMMPEPYSSMHDSYLRNYLKSGTPKVIGKGGRVVVTKHANGSVAPVHLEIDECILEGQRYFVGLMQPKDATKKKKQTLLEKTRAVVDQLAVPSIVINTKGIVQAFNGPATTLFGYEPTEVIGKNVQVLMNEQDARNHDEYIARHLRTGEERIVGRSRLVMIRQKNGQSQEVSLSISKTTDPDDINNILFTGTLMPIKKK